MASANAENLGVSSHLGRFAAGLFGLLLIAFAIEAPFTGIPVPGVITLAVASLVFAVGPYLARAIPPIHRPRWVVAAANWVASVRGRDLIGESTLPFRFPAAVFGGLLPVVLPGEVVVVLGAKLFGVVWQIALALGFVASVAAVIYLENGSLRAGQNFLRRFRRDPAGLVAVIAAAVVVIALAAATYARATLKVAVEVSQPPGYLVVAGLLCWLGAICLRLISLGRTVLRTAALFVLFCLLYLLLAKMGATPSNQPIGNLFNRDWDAWAYGFGITIAAASVLEAVLRLGGWLDWVTRKRVRRIHHASKEIGALFSAAASVLMAAVVFSAWLVSYNTEQPQVISRFERAPVIPAAIASLPLRSARRARSLAQTYSPVLVYPASEHWHATIIDNAYLHNLRAVSLTAVPQAGPGDLKLAALPTCSSSRSPCWKLTCALPDENTCTRRDEQPTQTLPGRPPTRVFADGGIYARVVTRAVNPGPLAGVLYNGERPEAFVQYWLYYPYDDWLAATVGGIMEQQHEGDWEMVLVAFSSARPLFVAYSAHCGGNWYPWPTTPATTAPQADPPEIRTALPTHPLVAVARGSHANYARATAKRSTDWASCRKIDRDKVRIVSYAANLRDITGDGWKQIPEQVVIVNPHKRLIAPMTFHGRWANSDVLDLRTLASRRLIVAGDGPTTPALKGGLWTEPLWTVLGCDQSGRWHQPPETSARVTCLH